MAVDAVLNVADLERKDVRLDLIKLVVCLHPTGLEHSLDKGWWQFGGHLPCERYHFGPWLQSSPNEQGVEGRQHLHPHLPI